MTVLPRRRATADTQVRPFPWRTIDATTRVEVDTFARAKRWASGHIRLHRIAAAITELLGAEVRLTVSRVQSLSEAPPLDEGIAVLVAGAGTPDGTQGALVEAEGSLAAAVVSRALGRAPPRVVGVGTAAAPSIHVAGAFAAVLLSAARRAHAEVALRVISAGPAKELETALSGADPHLFAVTMTVLVGDDAFAARVVVTRSAFGAAPPPWDARALASLGPVPLHVPVVVCAVLATLDDLGGARPGDALVLFGAEEWPLAREASGGVGRILGPRAVRFGHGPVLLAPPGAAVGLCARIEQDGRLVVVGGVAPLRVAEEHMASDENSTVVEALADVPLVIRVEIGEAVMSARDWASIGRGDVVALGRRIGDPVVLRVEGVAWARGELVDLEGEIAVRIIDRVGPGGQSSP